MRSLPSGWNTVLAQLGFRRVRRKRKPRRQREPHWGFEMLEDRRVMTAEAESAALLGSAIVVDQASFGDAVVMPTTELVVADSEAATLFDVTLATNDAGEPTALITLKDPAAPLPRGKHVFTLERRLDQFVLDRYEMTISIVGDELVGAFQTDRLAKTQARVAALDETAGAELLDQLTADGRFADLPAAPPSVEELRASLQIGLDRLTSLAALSSTSAEPLVEEDRQRLYTGLERAIGDLTTLEANHATAAVLDVGEIELHRTELGKAAIFVADQVRGDLLSDDPAVAAAAGRLRDQFVANAKLSTILWQGYGVNSPVYEHVAPGGATIFSAIYEAGRLEITGGVAVELNRPAVVGVTRISGSTSFNASAANTGLVAGAPSAPSNADGAIVRIDGEPSSLGYWTHTSTLVSDGLDGSDRVEVDSVFRFNLSSFSQYVSQAVVKLTPVDFTPPGAGQQATTNSRTLAQRAVVESFDHWSDGAGAPEWDSFGDRSESLPVRTVDGDASWNVISDDQGGYEPVELDVTQFVRRKVRQGDLNFNGMREGADDVRAFENTVHGTGQWQAYASDAADLLDRGDIDRDGDVDAADGAGFLAIHGALAGDANIDGVVDAYEEPWDSWGEQRDYIDGDYDFSGFVDSDDVALWSEHLGDPPPTPPIEQLSLRVYAAGFDPGQSRSVGYATREDATGKAPALTVAHQADVFAKSFSTTSDGELRVEYRVLNAAASSLAIDIYRSPDGVAVGGAPLMTHNVTESALLQPGHRWTTFAANLDLHGEPMGPDERLVTVVRPVMAGGEVSVANNAVEFLGGVIKDAAHSTIFLLGSEGDNTFQFSSSGGVSTVNAVSLAGITSIEGRLYGGDDRVLVAGGTQPSIRLFGGAGDDVLVGGTADDTIDGGAGHDILLGGTGSNALDWGNAGGLKDSIVVTTLAETFFPGGSTILSNFVTNNLNLRHAIWAAGLSDGPDVIEFAPDLTGNLHLLSGALTLAGDLTIDGPGADRVAVDAHNASRAFVVSAGANATIRGLTVKGGRILGDVGGGIYAAANSDLTLDGVRLTGNYSNVHGGGVFSLGDLTVVDSTIDLNEAASRGGGIEIEFDARLTMINSTVDRNKATYGGGLAAGVLRENAIHIEGSTFTANEVTSIGGAMLIQDWGGAISSGAIIASTISGNKAAVGGGTGGVRVYYGFDLEIRNTTITDNRGDWGGGLSLTGAPTVTLHNTILVDNWNAAGTASDDFAGNANLFAASSHNMLRSGSSGGLTTANNNIVLASGAAAGLTPLGDYGGPTRIHALLPTSPAIDKGSDSLARGAWGDQRGFGLDIDIPSIPNGLGGISDIGAFEFRRDLVVTTLADAAVPAGQLSLRQALNVERTLPGGAVTFAPGLEGEITLRQGSLTLDNSVAIVGPGADRLAINAHGASRVLDVWPLATASVSGVTLTGGFAPSAGGVLNYGDLTLDRVAIVDNQASTTGGGILSLTGWTGTASLHLIDSTVDGNRALYGAGLAVYLTGVLEILGSTVSNNGPLVPLSHYTEAGGLRLEGTSTGSATIRNSTFSGNSARYGGGIRMSSNFAPLSVTHTTIVDNTAYDGGGWYNFNSGNTVTLHRSIVAGNASTYDAATSDVSGAMNSASSHNLFGVGAGANDLSAAALANLIGSPQHPRDPLLTALGDHGGSTHTHALLPASPAIDAAGPEDVPKTDQRGFARVKYGDLAAPAIADLGAFEAGGILATTSGETAVNAVSQGARDFLAGDQNSPMSAFADDGTSVVVWADVSSEFGANVLGRRIDAEGRPLGPIFTLAHLPSTLADLRPRIASDGAGRFVVVWQEVEGGDYHVRARSFAFDAEGALAFKTADAVAVSDASLESDAPTWPSVAMAASGEFLVVWESTAGTKIYSRIYDSLSAPVTGVTAISSADGSPTIEMLPVAAAAYAGGFAAIWIQHDELIARRSAYNPTTGGWTWLDPQTVANRFFVPEDRATLLANSAGDLTVVWAGYYNGAPDENYVVRSTSQKAHESTWGLPVDLTNATPAPGYPEGAWSRVRIGQFAATLSEQGHIVAAWQEMHEYDDFGITEYLRRTVVQTFDATGAPLGGPLPGEFADSGDFRSDNVALASGPGGRLALIWQEHDGEPGAATNIHAQLLHADWAPAVAPARRIEIVPVSDVTVVAGDSPLDLVVNATYWGGDWEDIRIVATGGSNPSSLTVTMDPVVSGRAHVAWDYASAAAGVYEITLRAFDQSDPAQVDVAVVRVRVVPTMGSLTIDDINPQTVVVGEELVLRAFAHDADGPGLQLRFALVAGVPATMSINAHTGAIRWTPAAGDVGVHEVQVVVVDPTAPNRTASTTFEVEAIAANVAPTIAGPASLQMLEGGTFEFGGTFTIVATDPDQLAADPLEIKLEAEHGLFELVTAADVDFLAGQASGGARIIVLRGASSQLNEALGDLEFSAAAEFHGTAEVRVTVDDLGNGGAFPAPLNASRIIPITVLPVSDFPDESDAYYAVGHTGLRVGNLLLDAGLQRFVAGVGPVVRMLSVFDGQQNAFADPAADTAQIPTAAGATLTIARDGSFTYDPSTIPPASLVAGAPLTDEIVYEITDDEAAVVVPGTWKFDVVKSFTADVLTLGLEGVELVEDDGARDDDRRTTDPRIAGTIVDQVPDADSFVVEFDVDAADNFDAVLAGLPTEGVPLTVDYFDEWLRSAPEFPAFEFDPGPVAAFQGETIGRKVIAFRVQALNGGNEVALSEWEYFEFTTALPGNEGDVRFELIPRRLVPSGIAEGLQHPDPPVQQDSYLDPTITGIVHGAFAPGDAAIVFDVTVGQATTQHTLVLAEPGEFFFDLRTLPQLAGEYGGVAIDYQLRERIVGAWQDVEVNGSGQLAFTFLPLPTTNATAVITDIVADGVASLGGRYWIRGWADSPVVGTGVLGGEQFVVEFDYAYDGQDFDGEADADATAEYDPEEGAYAFELFVAQLPGPNAKAVARAGKWDPIAMTTLFGEWSAENAFEQPEAPAVVNVGDRALDVIQGAPGIPPTVVGYLEPTSSGDLSSVAYVRVELFFQDGSFTSGPYDAIVTTDGQGAVHAPASRGPAELELRLGQGRSGRRYHEHTD